MKKYLIILLSVTLWATALFTPSSASAQTSFSTDCRDLGSFLVGCESSGGRWSSAFIEYAEANGIAPNTRVGARVQFFPQGNRPLEEVMYIIGPYLPAEDAGTDSETIVDERELLANWDPDDLVPAMNDVRVRLRDLDVSIVYIGFGHVDDSQQPVAQRVVATKRAIREFEKQRRVALGHRGHATALTGLSLGGVVGKIALTELESEGFDHGVETYVSFDAPHWGAYTPIGLQTTPLYLASSFRWIERNLSWAERIGSGQIDQARDGAMRAANLTVRNPVAQDVLMLNVAYEGWKAPNADYIRNRKSRLPKATKRNVAIASGAIDGTRPQLGEFYFDLDTGRAVPQRAQARLHLEAKVPTLANRATFWGHLSHAGLFDRPKSEWGPQNAPAAWVDIETGSCAHMTTLVDGPIAKANVELPKIWRNYRAAALENRACFVPTFSAIAGFRNQLDSSPFDVVIGDSENKQHLTVSPQMRNELLSELDRVFRTAPTSTPTSTPPPPTTRKCEFSSGTHNLADTRAMFPDKCGTAWNDQRHKCDYDSNGWHCRDI